MYLRTEIQTIFGALFGAKEMFQWVRDILASEKLIIYLFLRTIYFPSHVNCNMLSLTVQDPLLFSLLKTLRLTFTCTVLYSHSTILSRRNKRAIHAFEDEHASGARWEIARCRRKSVKGRGDAEARQPTCRGRASLSIPSTFLFRAEICRQQRVLLTDIAMSRNS